MKGLNTRVFDFNFVCGVDFFPIGLCDQNQLQNNYENRIKMYVTRDVVPVDRKKDVKCRHTHSFAHTHNCINGLRKHDHALQIRSGFIIRSLREPMQKS